MIHSITIITSSFRRKLEINNQNNKFIIDCPEVFNSWQSFDIEIEFLDTITAFRNHDYKWVDIKGNRIANEFSPKILKLSNDFFVQVNINLGFWEINKNKPKKLLWRFNPIHSKPLTVYTGVNNEKTIVQANSILLFNVFPTLLFTKKAPIEFSRSKIPFSAIACFTDHCDFDTLENLKVQREFFNQNSIKITKGFFLNHFSKRQDNASYQNDQEEIDAWIDTGHELCYHSLSQSIKSYEESINDFEKFIPPVISPTWIDHGYQPYNFSLFQNSNISEKYYESILTTKNISTLWNYIDCGTSTNGVINQLNRNQFTLAAFSNGNKNLGFIKRVQLIIKNIVFHYYANESIIVKYKSIATNFKKLVYKKQIKAFPKLISSGFQVFLPLLHVFLFWNKKKNITYKLAKYSPILFKHRIFNNDFYVFQTIEMIDFKKSLSKKNVDLLVQEKGLFIAHTYFSVPISYHQGKMFRTKDFIDEEVKNNFNYLSKKIKDESVWNPTLNELIAQLSLFEDVIIDMDNKGNLFLKNETELIYKKIV